MKTKLLTLSLIIAITINSCSKSRMTEPEQIGKKVFKILETINKKGKQEYIENFISAEEILKSKRENEVISEENESNLNQTSADLKEKLYDEITSDYNQIKEKGVNSGIIWQEIEYLDFIYEIRDEKYKFLEGKIYFKYNQETFMVNVDAVWIENQYRIFQISNLKRK